MFLGFSWWLCGGLFLFLGVFGFLVGNAGVLGVRGFNWVGLCVICWCVFLVRVFQGGNVSASWSDLLDRGELFSLISRNSVHSRHFWVATGWWVVRGLVPSSVPVVVVWDSVRTPLWAPANEGRLFHCDGDFQVTGVTDFGDSLCVMTKGAVVLEDIDECLSTKRD